MVKDPPADAGDTRNVHSIHGLGRSGKGNGTPLQYSCLENPLDRGACRKRTVHRITKTRTRLKRSILLLPPLLKIFYVDFPLLPL